MARRFDLIAFDWDGTLWDSTAAITRALQSAVHEVTGERPSADRTAYVIGLGLRAALTHVAPGAKPEQFERLGQRYRHHFAQEMGALQLFDGVLDLLDELHARGHWVAVATGKSRSGLNEALHAHQLKGRFHASRTADETRGKPHPAMLNELMLEFDVPPQRTLMIGDTSHDLMMAANAGCASLGVAYGAHAGESLRQHAPLAVLHSVPELRGWLREHA